MSAQRARDDEPILAAYYTGQAEGAILNGCRVVKVNSAPNDVHKDGTTGVVIGSLAFPSGVILPPELLGYTFGYWVRWDGDGLPPVFVLDRKIKEVAQ